jgi:hypothetical protein
MSKPAGAAVPTPLVQATREPLAHVIVESDTARMAAVFE